MTIYGLWLTGLKNIAEWSSPNNILSLENFNFPPAKDKRKNFWNVRSFVIKFWNSIPSSQIFFTLQNKFEKKISTTKNKDED